MKRLNLKLLITLLVVAAVVTGGAYGVWRFQMKRNAQNYLVWATDKHKEGNIEDEAQNLKRYLNYDRDNYDVQARYALVLADLAESQVTSSQRVMESVSALNRTLRLYEQQEVPKEKRNPDIRDRLATLLMRQGRAPDAIQQLDRLMKETEGDKKLSPEEKNLKLADIEKRMSECYMFSGDDQKAVALLKQGIEHNPKDVNLYERLFAMYQQRLKDNEAAGKILEEMVKVNPESWEAYLRRYQYKAREGVTDEVRADLAQALKFGPQELQVLMAAAERATNDKDFDKGRDYLKEAAAAHPDAKELFIAMSQLERFAGQPDAAMAALEDGLKKHADDPSMLWLLTEMRIRTPGSLDKARELITSLEKVGIPADRLDFLRAQVLLAERRYSDALLVLNRIRPNLAGAPGFEDQIDTFRAFCYRALGETDQEINVLKQRLLADPLNRQVRLDLGRALFVSGQTDEAVREVGDMAQQGEPMAQLLLFQALLAKNLSSPEDKRDWSVTDQLIEVICQRNEADPIYQSMKSEYYAKKGDLAKAQEALDQAREKFSNEPAYWLAQIDLTVTKAKGDKAPQKGLAVLDEAVKKIGEKPQFRLARVSLLAQIGDDASKQQLFEMYQNIGQLPEEEQGSLMTAVANALYALRNFDQAREIYTKLAEKHPNDLRTQLMLYSVIRDQGDDAGMQSVVENIRKIAGEDDSYAEFCDAARIVQLVQQNKQPVSALASARQMLDKAAKQRPNWGALLRLRGEIDEREGKQDGAIENYQRALDLGETNPLMIRKLAGLLLVKNRGPEINQVIDKVPNAREFIGPKLRAIVDLMRGNVLDSVEAAKEAAALEKDDYATQLWLGTVLQNAGDMRGAEEAYRKATELGPQEADTWLALARFLSEEKRVKEVPPLVKEIEAKVKPEQRELALAACYEVALDPAQAEKHYLQALEAKPEDLRLLEAVANFYIRQKNAEKTIAYVNRLMEAGKKAPPDQLVFVQRARRTMAGLMANNGTAKDYNQAIQLIEQNATPGKGLSADDLSLKAQFFARLGDSASREAAIQTLQDLIKSGGARPNDRVLLAGLQDAGGKWREAKDTMREALRIGDDKSNARSILAFVDLLLRHNEAPEAASWLDRLRKLELERDPNFIALEARLLKEQKKSPEAIELVKSQITRPVPPNELPLLREVADQLYRLGGGSPDKDLYNKAAEDLYREYFKEVPQEGFALANFIGQERTLEEAFAVCKQSVDAGANPDRAARLGLALLHAKPEQINDKLLAQEDEWMTKSSERNPDAADMLLLVADLRDLEGRHDDAIKIYRDLLKRTDVQGANRVATQNNLAFVLALKERKGDEALPLIEEAIKAQGPQSELLDTRGVVYLVLGKPREALLDLENAIASNPTMIKYFHLAQAHMAANDLNAAADFFERAQNAGLNEKTVPALEKADFERLRRDLPSRSASARS